MSAHVADGFTFHFGERVRVRSPHPEAGCEGHVLNAWLFRDGRERVFVSVPGGSGSYNAGELEPAGNPDIPQTPLPQAAEQ